jgi:hypothetical protein
MSRVRRILQLPAADRLLLMQTLLLVSLVRIGLWLLPFKTMLALAERAARRAAPAQPLDAGGAQRLVWAVAAVSRCIPAATCLTQALAAQILLRRQGIPAKLRIGVAKGGAGRLEAHAWLEGEQGVLIGDLPHLDRFIQLPSLDAARS